MAVKAAGSDGVQYRIELGLRKQDLDQTSVATCLSRPELVFDSLSLSGARRHAHAPVERAR